MSGTIPCTVGILTKNSAATLPRALESVKKFAEIIICDGGSTDATLEIAGKYGAKIIPQNKDFLDDDGYIKDFSGVRNQSLTAATYEWYLFVDSDEYASPELVEAIREVIASRRDGAFNVFRRYVLRGEEVECAASYPNRSMRFFSRRSVERFRKIVHERPQLRDGVLPQDLKGPLFVPMGEDMERVWKRNERYIALEVKRKGRVGFFKFLGYARWEMRSSLGYTIRLVRNYMFCRGRRLPLSIELARYKYPFTLLAALWRARKAKYPPNVLFFINKWKTGGAEHVFLQELLALRDSGVSVRYGAAYGDIVPTGVDARHGVFPHFRNLLDVGAYVRLISEVGAGGITHVFATLEHASIIARVAGMFMPRVRIVISEPGMADRKPFRYKLLDIMLNVRTNAIVAVSSGVQKSLLRYQALHRRKMTVLSNGVAVPERLPERREDPRFTVLGVGSLRREKGFENLIEAFSGFLNRTGADAELVIAGKGILQEGLQQHVSALGLTERVRLIGELSHEEVYDWYRTAGCFVLSSISEGNPNVVLEALSQGTPVIATAVSGAEDIVEDGVSGLLVPPGSARALSEALERLYADPSLREQLGRNAFERAKQFSFDAHMQGLREILRIPS